jgi:UV DNA damage endonuclease
MSMRNFNFGYACINTTLRKKKVFSSRTCRLSTFEKKGLVYVQELALKNLNDLMTILEWNKENNILFMRLSSDMFPFASHAEHGYDLNFADALLKKIGKFANENNMRLTMHPGQYNVLSSPNEKVVQNTFRDLNHHCDILDRMGMHKNSVMIVHGGGVYGNKKQALERLSKNIMLLPECTRNRLVLENCEMSYCIEDLLSISEELGIPIVIDFHHDSIYPSPQPTESYFDKVFDVWNTRGIKPKVHVSNSCEGITVEDTKTARRKHSDYIEFLHEALLTIKFPIDVMFEAKMKEQAILKFLETHKQPSNPSL